MKRIIALIGLTALLSGCTGCSTSTTNLLTPAVVQQGVATGVAYAVAQYPEARPGVDAAAQIICSDASGATLDPAKVVADIQKIDPSLNTPMAVLIENSALTLYIGVWQSYGASAVTNSPVLKTYLQATCAGMNSGLGNALTAKANAPTNVWPIIHPQK